MVTCLICGVKKEYSIVEHLKYVHKINSKAYKSLYSNAKVRSEKFSEKVSSQFKSLWEDPNYRGKMVESRKRVQGGEDFRKKHSLILKKSYKEGRSRVWSTGLTKETNDSLKKRSEHLSRLYKGRSKKDFEYLQKSSERIKSLYLEGKSYLHNLSSEKESLRREKIGKTLSRRMQFGEIPRPKFDLNALSKEKREIWKEKISKTLANRVSSGELGRWPTLPKYKTGYFVSKTGEKFWYQSGLELEAMELLESLTGLSWTTHHKIRIKYLNEDQEWRYYVPDFKIQIGAKLLILEMKGYFTKEVKLKEDWARKEYENYYICYSVAELKEVLDAFLKN